MAVHCIELGYTGLNIPSDLKISLGPQVKMSLRLCPWHISRASKNLLVIEDIKPNPLGSVHIQYSHCVWHIGHFMHYCEV